MVRACLTACPPIGQRIRPSPRPVRSPVDLLATTPDPARVEAFVRLSTVLMGLAVLGVISVTVLALGHSSRRRRLGRQRRARQVTSRLSAWEEAGARADPPPPEFDEADPNDETRLG